MKRGKRYVIEMAIWNSAVGVISGCAQGSQRANAANGLLDHELQWERFSLLH
jgi:hypothetical protein